MQQSVAVVRPRLRHVSKADGSQSLDLQRDALIAAGVGEDQTWGNRGPLVP